MNDQPILPSPKVPMAVARELIDDHHTVDGQLTLRHWRDTWMRWRTTHWAEVDDAEIRAWLYAKVERAHYIDGNGKAKPWDPNRSKVADLLDAIRAVTYLSNRVQPPAWLDGDQAHPATYEIAVANGIVEIGGRQLSLANPRHFALVSVPFAFDADAPTPTRWLQFLKELWPDDDEQIAALQEWFGYVISGHTDLHKILLLVGPTRAGKGVIGRVLTALIGAGNVSGLTLSSLGSNFGLQDLVTKPLAIISDARLGRGDANVVVERLLSISGEDTITVDRKYRDPWSGRLPTRFTLLTNELPRLATPRAPSLDGSSHSSSPTRSTATRTRTSPTHCSGSYRASCCGRSTASTASSTGDGSPSPRPRRKPSRRSTTSPHRSPRSSGNTATWRPAEMSSSTICGHPGRAGATPTASTSEPSRSSVAT